MKKIKYTLVNVTAYHWWLRSADRNYHYYAASVDNYGLDGVAYCNSSYGGGVVPICIIN